MICFPSSHVATRRRAGFTFIEVLFAVILLGIGFILVAAVFPVAIEQGQASIQETAGTLICRDAIRTIEAVASATNYVNGVSTPTLFPQTPGTTVVPIPFSSNSSPTGSNAYLSADRRYGWVGFYRRPNLNDPFMQVWVIALQNASFGDAANPPSAPPSVPSGITAKFQADPNGVEYVDISNGTNAVEGAYVLVADNSGGGITAPANGRVFRLGNAIAGATNRFQLAPGYDMLLQNNVPSESTSGAISVYIIGRSPTTGANQDLIVQTSFVQINN